MATRNDDDVLDGEDRDPRPPRRRRSSKKRKTVAADAQSPARRVWRVARLVLMGGVALMIVGLLFGTGLFLYYASDDKLPKLERISDYKPPRLTRVLDRHGKQVGTLGAERRTLVPFAKLPKHFVNAVVSAEDPNFFKHEGVDYRGLLRAFLDNVLEGRVLTGRWGQGGSTITQQVVKELLLTRQKTLRRKVQELILARRISQRLSKEDVFTIYVNQINYGHGTYGCEEGARYYFGKSIAEADVAQAAFLAGVPQLPERHSPHKNPESAKNRQVYVLRQMVAHGHLDAGTAERLAKEPIKVIPATRPEATAAPEALNLVYRRLVEKFGAEALPTLGATVETTIDLELQRQARAAVEEGLRDLDERQRFRGSIGHVNGKALEARRAALMKARADGKIKDSSIVEGIVEKVQRDPQPPGDKQERGKLYVDIGGIVGVVDVAAEARYASGSKPLLARFKPGDIVRVRLAPERKPIGSTSTEALLALELGPQAAMVVLEPRTREILALVGGYDFRPGGYDRSWRASRQAGSAFKPFVYAAAIDSGRLTAASVVNDVPQVYDLWKPENYDKEQFRGPVRLRVALADSINTVPIQVLADVGIQGVIDLARRAGITSDIPAEYSIALGANSVTPLELARAYGTFAAAGQRVETPLITKINGEAVDPPPTPVSAFKPETAYVLTSMMRSVTTEGTARAAGARVKRPIAGKTGTSSQGVDAWFVGYSAELLAAVWVGFDDNRSLGRGEAGGRTAVPIWTDFMVKALADKPVKDFPVPPALDIVRIDPATGLLPAPGADGVEEVFLAGTAPRDVAPAPGEAANADKLLLEQQD